jgi:hypothetical protein
MSTILAIDLGKFNRVLFEQSPPLCDSPLSQPVDADGSTIPMQPCDADGTPAVCKYQ